MKWDKEHSDLCFWEDWPPDDEKPHGQWHSKVPLLKKLTSFGVHFHLKPKLFFLPSTMHDAVFYGGMGLGFFTIYWEY